MGMYADSYSPNPSDPELFSGSGKRSPRLVSTASVALTLPMHVPRLPAIGTSVTASSSYSLVGDGYVVLSAVARQGLRASLAAPLGTGANSHAVRAALMEEGITLAVPDKVGDTGISISLIQADGLMTTVRSPGVEADPSLQDLRNIKLFDDDVVFVSGLDLDTAGSANVLQRWLSEISPDIRVVFSVSGAVNAISSQVLSEVLRRADIVTMNAYQARVLQQRFDFPTIWQARKTQFSDDAIIVVRKGAEGVIFQEHAGQRPIRIWAKPQVRVDTNGVGDTHTGVMIAGLMQGLDLTTALWRANLAASVSVSKFGTAVCPTEFEIDQLIKQEDLNILDMVEEYEGEF